MAYWRVGGGNPVNETANCRLHIMNIFRNKFKEELRDKSANIYFGELPHRTHFTLSPPLNKQRGLPQPITTLIPCSISCSGHNKLHLLACVWISRILNSRCAMLKTMICKIKCAALIWKRYCSCVFLSSSGDLGIGLVWDNPTGPDRTPPPLFGPTVEILFKVN